MRSIDVSDATKPLARYAEEMKNGPIDNIIVVTEDGKPIVVVVPVKGSDWESLSLGTNPRFLALLDRSREERKQYGGLSSAEVRERFDLPRRTKPSDG
jgi:hypothetical protein